jgi:hypothetical protein
MQDINSMSAQSGRFLNEQSEAKNIIEPVTGSIKTISNDHASIYKGEGFSVSGTFINVPNGSTANYAFKTPSVASGKVIRLKQKEFFTAGNKLTIDLHEAPNTDPSSGSALIAYNHNRMMDTAVTAMQSLKLSATIVLSGTARLENLLTGYQSAIRSSGLERILKPDTWYIRVLTNGTGAAADINFFEFWYEEDAV